MRMVENILPQRIYRSVLEAIPEGYVLEEIRVRLGRQAYIVASGKSIRINVIATEGEMLQILNTVSHGSLYAYRDCMIKGYIPLSDGIRIGIVGRAGVDNSRITGIYDINEFSIRIPHSIRVDCDTLIPLAQMGSMLIYSPPGEGKTTLLREIARRLSSGRDARRVAVVDTRDELATGLEDKSLLVSLLSGYPRRDGIEIAVRTMNAQTIVCDEIGGTEDARAIIEAQGAGVPLIASCHALSLRDMLSHSGMRELHKYRIFEHYVGIRRSENQCFEYNISTWSQANDNI